MKWVRKSLILAHRYLGTGGMPGMTAELRLLKSAAIDFSQIRLTPIEAAARLTSGQEHGQRRPAPSPPAPAAAPRGSEAETEQREQKAQTNSRGDGAREARGGRGRGRGARGGETPAKTSSHSASQVR